MKLIKATINDLSEIERLNNKYFKEKRDFKKIINDQNNNFYILKDNKKLIGFTGLQILKWNNTGRIIDIFIHPNYRRQGLGHKMIKKIINDGKKQKIRTIIAEAFSLNSVLILYLKNNFRICGFNDRYYNNSGKEIALFLSFDLK